MPYSAIYASPLGDMLMQSEDGKSLCQLSFCEGDEDVEVPQELNSGLPLFENVQRWLDIYFSGSPPPFIPKLSLTGTELQKAAWKEAMQIPFGQRSTYGEIAKRLSRRRPKPCSSRGVGSALARNTIAIIVPCHRVLGEDGSLKGYKWGADFKQGLLLHEAMATFKGATFS